MATIYVREQGSVVHKQGERLLVKKDREMIDEIPMHDLEQLVLMGGVQLTQAAIAMLLRSNTDVVFMTIYGRVIGRLLHNESKFAELRLRQLQTMSNDAANLALARQIVIGKLTNQRALLMQARANHVDIERGVRGIAEMIQAAKQTGDAEQLRGYEGSAGARYWAGFRVLLKYDFGFTKREYHPSPDPVNALLSYVYTLLQKDVMAAVQLVGMDPYLGFFHVIEYGRPSLALDLMEEFRPLLCDPIVLNLLNLQILQPHDFQRTGDPARPVVMREDAVKRVIEKYEERVNATTRYVFLPQPMETSWRRIFELQVRQMARVVKGEDKVYRAMLRES